MRDHFVKQLTQEALTNKDIILITGDLGFGVLTNFEKEFPAQYINAGVAEQNMTGLATGLGMSGKTVFTYSIGNFCTLRCLEQIRNDACYHDANVNVVSVGGGFSYGALGYSHHATEDIAIMRALPNLRVFVPCDFWEAIQITKHLCASKGVNYLRIDKSAVQIPTSRNDVFVPGKARTLRHGNDFTIIGCGGILEEALAAAEHMSTFGVQIRVISMHTIKPIDTDAIKAATHETGGILTIEEHTISGGLGSAVGEVVLDGQLPCKRLIRMGLHSGFSTVVGSQQYLRRYYNMDAQAITERLLEVLPI
jgi:transketolase